MSGDSALALRIEGDGLVLPKRRVRLCRDSPQRLVLVRVDIPDAVMRVVRTMHQLRELAGVGREAHESMWRITGIGFLTEHAMLDHRMGIPDVDDEICFAGDAGDAGDAGKANLAEGDPFAVGGPEAACDRIVLDGILCDGAGFGRSV